MELRSSPERLPGQRRAAPRQLDKRHSVHRQHAPGRPEPAPRRIRQSKQRPQRVLHASAAAWRDRPVRAGSLPRLGFRRPRHRTVLGCVLPVFHDRHRHRALPQPDSRSAPRTRLCFRRLLLCLRHVDRPGNPRHSPVAQESLIQAGAHRPHRSRRRVVRYRSGNTAADGFADLGRPRPLRALHHTRLRFQLPEFA